MKSTISGRLFAVLSPRNSIAPGVSQPAAVLGGSGALSGGETTHEPDEQRCSLALWMQQRFTSPFRNVNGKDLRSMLAYIKEDGRLLSVHDDIEDAAPEIKRRVRSTFHSMMQLLATDCGVNLQIVASIWTVFQEIKNVHGRLGLRGMKRIQSFKFNTFSARLHALFSGGHAQGIEFENLVLLYGCFNITAEREIKLLACFLTFDETQTGRLDHHDIQELAHGFFKPQADVERRINASDVYRSQEAKKHRRRMKKLEESLEALSGDTVREHKCVRNGECPSSHRFVCVRVVCAARLLELDQAHVIKSQSGAGRVFHVVKKVGTDSCRSSDGRVKPVRRARRQVRRGGKTCSHPSAATFFSMDAKHGVCRPAAEAKRQLLTRCTVAMRSTLYPLQNKSSIDRWQLSSGQKLRRNRRPTKTLCL